MAETHELRLKINAAAARAGAREFVGAIKAIKTAVRELERDSDGIFKRLKQNLRDAGKAANIKIKGIDRTSVRNLDAFAKSQQALIKNAVQSRRALSQSSEQVRRITQAYINARTASDAWVQSMGRANTALSRQAGLAGRTAGAMAGGGSGGGGGDTRAATAAQRAGDAQIAMQNRIQREISNTQVTVERLVTSLMKVGGFSQLNAVTNAFAKFQKEVSGGAMSAQQLDTAKTKLNSTLKRAQTAMVTLTAKQQESARAEKMAAQATKERETANARVAATAKQAATATAKQATEAAKLARVQDQAARSVQMASEKTAQLTQKMRSIGGSSRGIVEMNQALIRLKAALSGGNVSATQLRTAMAQFNETASRARVNITNLEGAQNRTARSARDLAKAENDAAAAARRVERQMRSTAGASSAVSRSFRDATGSMRGLENAFSGTFQVGTAFRTMLGSITFGTFIQSVYSAGRALDQFRVTMEVATGTMAGAADQMDFIDGMAAELGTNLRTAREDFSKFAISANLAGVETATAQNIFRSVSSAMAVMGRSAEDQRLAFLALEQMLSKNTVSSEELRRQLGERLPGAVNLMAKAVGVTTAELQDMLKAGSLVSSEVLPKFAKEVDKAFGPGLEAALSKAPVALGRLRNEFEFFLSAIADSGFTEALAEGFNGLAGALRQPDTQAAAKALGSTLADLAETAIDVAQIIIENIDDVARVMKAIVAGVIARQVTLLIQAFLVAGQQAGASFGLIRAAFATATPAVAANTTAVTANTASNLANAKSLMTMKAGHDVALASMMRSTTAAAASSGVMGRLGATMGTVGRGAGFLAAGMGRASMVLAGLAGPIGIAVTALSLLPLLFMDTAEDVDTMADQIDSALRRAGASFETFEATVRDSTSNLNLQSTLSDIDLLDTQLGELATNNTAKMQGLQAILSSLGRGGGQVDLGTAIPGPSNMTGESLVSSEDALGLTEDQLMGFSSGARQAIGDMVEMTLEAQRSGEGFLELRDALAAAMIENPSASGVIAQLAEMTQQSARMELALVNNRNKLVELYGTPNEKLAKSFADTAARVVRTGEGLDNLRKEVKQIENDSPGAAEAVREIFEATEEALRTGTSSNTFLAGVQDAYSVTVDRLEDLRSDVKTTEAAAQDAATAFATAFDTAFSDIRAETRGGLFGGGIEIPEGTLKNLSRLRAEVEQFDNFAISMEAAGTALDAFGERFPEAEAQAFTAAIRAQFAALPEGQQTYEALSNIISQVAIDQGVAADSAQVWSGALRASVQDTNNVQISTAEYIDELGRVKDSMPTPELAGMVQKLIDAARTMRDADSAAAGAKVELNDTAAAAREVGRAGDAAAAGLRNMLGVFNAISSVGAAITGKFNDALGVMNERLELEGLDGADRKVGEFFASFGEGGRILAETDAQIADLQEQIRTGNFQDGAAAQMNREVQELIAARGKFVEQATQVQTAIFAAQEANSSSGSGSSGTKEQISDTEKLIEAMQEYSGQQQEEILANQLLYDGRVQTAEAAQFMAEAMRLGIDVSREDVQAKFAQIDAVTKLKEKMEELANDPVNDWMNSVSSWREAGQQIETEVFGSLSDEISKFIQTGKFSFEDLGASILATVSDIVADKAVKELVTLFGGNTTGEGEGGFGLGGLLSDAFGNGGSMGDEGDPFAAGGGVDPMVLQNALVTGGQQAAEFIRQAMTSGGSMAQGQISAGGAQAGAQMGQGVTQGAASASPQLSGSIVTGAQGAAPILSSATSAGAMTGAPLLQQGIEQGSQTGGGFFQSIFGGMFGGGGGGGGGGFGSMLLGFLPSLFGSGGGVTGGAGPAMPSVMAPAGMFKNAPSFAMGTPNISGGVPAILHDNEAVVPLSGGRKIPIEGGGEMGGGSKTVVQNFNISTPDADSFRRSQSQIAADAAMAGQRAMSRNR